MLSDCVDASPSSFIPPYNTYDGHTVDALRSAGIRIISGGWWFTDDYYGDSRLFESDGVLHVPVTHDVVNRYEPLELFDLSTLQTAFDEVHGPGGLFVPMIHYQHFETEESLEKLRSFVQYIRRHDGVGFATLSGFGEAYLDGEIKRDEDGWLYTPS